MSRHLLVGVVCALVSMPMVATGWLLARYAATSDISDLVNAILFYFFGALLSGMRSGWEADVHRERTET